MCYICVSKVPEQMKYDVFISYSRKDFDEVKQLIDFIKQRIPTLSYWFDLTGIESGDEFEDKIISAIDNSAYVIFALSDNSIESNWTKDEVTYAKNTDKKVIPILLKGAKLKGWFLFKFGRIDCIDSTDRRQMDKFLENLSNWTGKALTSGEINHNERNEVEEISINSTPPQISVPVKTYKVGDYYDDGKKQGVVFEVSADGKHGKIVSLTESSCGLAWSSDSKEKKRLIGADDNMNGANNMAKVKSIAGWREKYPAFAWCADLGEGWYLPAIDELKLFTLNYEIHDAVNRTLATRGKKLAKREVFRWYWSSTEYDFKYFDGEFCAWLVNMLNGYTLNDRKHNFTYVRAVSAF